MIHPCFFYRRNSAQITMSGFVISSKSNVFAVIKGKRTVRFIHQRPRQFLVRRRSFSQGKLPYLAE